MSIYTSFNKRLPYLERQFSRKSKGKCRELSGSIWVSLIHSGGSSLDCKLDTGVTLRGIFQQDILSPAIECVAPAIQCGYMRISYTPSCQQLISMQGACINHYFNVHMCLSSYSMLEDCILSNFVMAVY